MAAGRFRRATLDVFDTELLRPGGPIRNAPRLLATPHIGYVTRDTYEAFFGGFVEAVLAFLGGHPTRVIKP